MGFYDYNILGKIQMGNTVCLIFIRIDKTYETGLLARV